MSTNQPAFVAFGSKDIGKGQEVLYRIGVAFAHKQKDGFSIVLDSLPLNFDGRIVLLPPKADAQQ